MKKIAIKRADGGVDIFSPQPGFYKEEYEKALQEVIGIIDATKGYVSHREIDDESIPTDRFFRQAWTDDFDSPTIDVHPDKAKEIKLNHFRELRKPLLEKLDLDFIRAIESNAETSEIVAKKQELRDITKITLPDDMEELKSYMPDILIEK